MREPENVTLIRQWHSLLGQFLMAPDVGWNITEGFPHGGVYRAHDAVGGSISDVAVAPHPEVWKHESLMSIVSKTTRVKQGWATFFGAAQPARQITSEPYL